ncbi:hypothetical protein ABBQ32_010586 [Trebouxia sp. C0010 RCD-2024]
MACHCLSGRTLTTVACDKLLTRRPLRLLTTARSQTNAGTTLRSVKSSHRHFFGSGSKHRLLTRASSQNVRPQHRILTQAGNQNPDIADRVVASVPYLIPLIDGLRYGKFFFAQFPAFAKLLAPLNPLVSLYFGVPFASFAVFFAVYLGIINNQNFSRYCRFNAMQAVLLDIVLILPGLIENVLRPPSSGPGLQAYISLYNSIWLFVFVCVAYGVGSCLIGQTPRLPFVADAADQQIR